MKTFLNEIKENEDVDAFFLIKEKTTGVTKTGNAYLKVKLGDRSGEMEGRIWTSVEALAESFKKDDIDPDRRAERLWEPARASAIVQDCDGRTGVVTEETKPTTQLSPLLFDLTSLQREANSRFGFSARTTLSLAQALYEKHKVLTYPRTDARALPEDYMPTVIATLETLKLKTVSSGAYAPFATQILKQRWVRPNKRIFDNKKISDHFAIIPTQQGPKQLNEAEAKIYDFVVRRFLAVFYPAAEYLQTTRITRVAEHPFKTDGKVLVNSGWLAVYGRSAADETENLPAVNAGETVKTLEVRAVAEQTKPPARFSEATLLSAMEGAGKLLEDEELRAAMDQKGLGTPATRAAVIEGLLREDYIHRNGRELQPTPKAFSLLFALKHFGIEELTSPELTGDWEYKLKQMELGQLARGEFMDHITSLTREMVSRVKEGEIPDTAFATVEAPCPRCGGTIQENYRKFQCLKCDFSLWKVLSSREWAPEEIAELIIQGKVGPLSGFRSRIGRPFVATIRLGTDQPIEFDFGQDRLDASGEVEMPNLEGKEPLGTCPKCDGRVFEFDMTYSCERSLGPAKTCDFRSGRIILQRPMEREQMVKLLATGKTDLLHRFISKKGRPFSAYLAKGPDGKIGFEFAPRKGKTAAPAAAAPAVSSTKSKEKTSPETASKPAKTKSIRAKASVKTKAAAPAAKKKTKAPSRKKAPRK